MGHNTVTPASGSLQLRAQYHREMFSGVHRAQVTDVNVANGTVNLSFENIVFTPENVTIPLLSLSAPPNTNVGERGVDFKSSGWGRYIPQIGDMLLVAFSPDGHIHALGYSTPYYGGYSIADQDNADTGGIGWGDTSGKNLKPGDWDFMAGRGGSLFLGDKANLSSSNIALSLSQFTQDATLSAPLFIQSATQSNIRYGAARRLVLPTSPQEEYMPSVRGGTTAQEFTVDMRWNNATTDGASIAYFAVGDVIDDTGTVPQIMVSDSSLPVKYYFSATDDTGLITSYEEMLDSLGNLEIESTTALTWKWSTPLAAWETTNLSTKFTSTSNFEISAGLEVSLTAGAKCTISATGNLSLESQALIQIGGDSATSAVVKGTEFISGLNTYLLAVNTAVQVTGSSVQNAAALKAIGVAALAFQLQLTSYLSTKAMVV